MNNPGKLFVLEYRKNFKVKKMSEKCEKYESLFIFGSEEELASHLEICEDCRQEHSKMQKTQNLIKEVKSYYETEKPNKKKLNIDLIKIATGIIILCLTCFSASHLLIDKKAGEYSLSYWESESIVSEMGLPTDEYGLLTVY